MKVRDFFGRFRRWPREEPIQVELIRMLPAPESEAKAKSGRGSRGCGCGPTGLGAVYGQALDRDPYAVGQRGPSGWTPDHLNPESIRQEMHEPRGWPYWREGL